MTSSGKCQTCGRDEQRYPTVGVAVVVRDEAGRVFMGRRAHTATAGLWCIPCGRLEWDEDVRDGAAREFLEETGMRVTLGEVIAVHSNFHNRDRQTVGIWFAGEVVSKGAPTDDEFTETGWFEPTSPPPLAFPTDALVLQQLAAES